MPPARLADPHVAISAFNRQAQACGWPFACAPARDFEQAELAAVSALWREKAGGRAIPDRADLTARAMKPYMPNMSLLECLEVADRRRYRVRLHGTALARYSGDSTGKFLEDVVHADRVTGYAAVYDLVLEALVPLRVVNRYQAPEISYLTGESFVAPLAANHGPIILSVTFPKPRTDIPMPRGSF